MCKLWEWFPSFPHPQSFSLLFQSTKQSSVCKHIQILWVNYSMAVTWRITLPGNKQTIRKQKTRERNLFLYHALFLTGSRGFLDWAVGLTCIFFPNVNTDCQVLCRLCEMHVATLFPSLTSHVFLFCLVCLFCFFLLVHGVCIQSLQCPMHLPTAKESAE